MSSDSQNKLIRANGSKVSRRDFLRFCSLAGLSAIAYPSLVFADRCDLTTSDIQGPFYSSGAPMRTVLADASEPGDRLFISGTIYGNDCTSPLEGAIVDVWAANDAGCYSRFESCTPVGDDFNLRGQMLTDANGNYAFETVRPGWYLNGATFRPQHLHIRFVTPDNDVIITQIYFEGDKYIADDPWASSPNAANRIIPLEQQNDGYHGIVDANLDSALTGLHDDPDDLTPDQFHLHQNYPNPFNGSTAIRYALASPANVKLKVYDQNGRQVTQIEQGQKAAGFHTAFWDSKDQHGREMASSVYYYNLTAQSSTGRFSLTKPMMLVK